jgi:uncharacterized protein (TIGR02588 family)
MTQGSQRRRSVAEWITLTLSVLVVGSLIVVALIEESRRQQTDGSDFQVTFDIERTVERDDSYYVPYTVVNTGPNAISSAEIWIEVYDGEVLVESAEVNIQFMPLQGKQDGLFVTTHDPSVHRMLSRLESLQFP